jgi:hypothetical protein
MNTDDLDIQPPGQPMTHSFLTITLSGAQRAGKTLIARALQEPLSRLGRVVYWHDPGVALSACPSEESLIEGGYSVLVVETQDPPAENALRKQTAKLKTANRRLRTITKILQGYR